MGRKRPHWRISDLERFDAAARLRAAAAQGRITQSELDERVQEAYEASTYGDLRPLLKDLPRPRRRPMLPVRPEPEPAVSPELIQRHDRSNSLIGSQTRDGVWEVGPVHEASAYLGGVTLDLRQAQFAGPEVEVRANVFLGSITIIVNKWTRVELTGTGVAGSFSEASPRVPPELGPGSPLLRVTGHALLGSVEVRRRRMPGEIRRRLLGR